MAKFNVGDEVIAVKASRGWGIIKEGDVGIVTVTPTSVSDEYTVKFENKESWYATESDLELFEPKLTKNQRITKLEERLDELELIVNKMRKPSTIVNDAVSEHAVTTIEFEGKQYRKVEREAREGDVIISLAEPTSFVKKGKTYKVSYDGERLVLNKGTSITVSLYNANRTPETVDVYELIKPSKAIDVNTKSPNQQRAEIIEEAKAFIEKVKCNVSGTVVKGMPDEGTHMTFKSVYMATIDGLRSVCKTEFFVNAEKRSVTVLLKGLITGKLYAKGIAKCHPDNVFNEHIGKAIALGRALGLDVSEFEQAVQPSIAVGQKVLRNDAQESSSIQTVSELVENKRPEQYHGQAFNTEEIFGWLAESQVRIINDTNAQYGGVE